MKIILLRIYVTVKNPKRLPIHEVLSLLNNNPTKWSNTLKQFVGNMPTTCLSVFDHFVGLTLKG